MYMLQECHYRGREECPVRILGYYTGQRESLDELGLLFLHYKDDVKKHGLYELKVFSFDCPKVGVNGYRIKDNVLAVGINFVNVRTLLLINNGFGKDSCYTINHASALSPENEKVLMYTKYYKSIDASKGIKTMQPIAELEISSSEAKVIFDTLQKHHYKHNGAAVNEDQMQKEIPLFDATIEYLQEVSKITA